MVIGKLFANARTVVRQERELTRMRAEIEQLRAQNESMRAGMRRCLTCDYRLMAKEAEPGGRAQSGSR